MFSSSEAKLITDAIRQAEKDTSGEIRVHIEKGKVENPLERAGYWFEKLGMQQTAQRNGVLIFLAPESRQFSIIGDKGIHEKVGDSFWEETRNIMQAHFREGNFSKGLTEGIVMAGKSLKQYFPFSDEDKNELTDDISFNDGQ